MKNFQRTDLAMESCQMEGHPISGVEQTEEQIDGCKIYRTKICCEEAAMLLGKPLGKYTTVECGNILYLTREESDRCAEVLAKELRGLAEDLLGRFFDENFCVLAVGLGNSELTADSIGPFTVSRLTATRHLREHEPELYRALGCSSLAILSPGVLGQTGIEALEILRSATETVCPDLILVIDALTAGSCDRLASTVQFSNVGIIPGSGVGNHRGAITAETVGVPVIAVGVPTVVDSSTLVYEALEKANIEEIDESLKKILENGRGFFVSPKESDVLVSHFSKLLSQAIELAFVGELPL